MTTRELEELAYPYDGDTAADFANRPIPPIETYWSETMSVQCPICNSSAIESNHVANKHPLDVASAIIEKLKSGKSTHAAGEFALWGFKEAWNRMRAEWKCGHCDARF